MVKAAIRRLGELLISLGSSSPSRRDNRRRHKSFDRKSGRLLKQRGIGSPVLAGAVQLIGLQKLQQQLGPAWDDIARQAYDIADTVIKRNLSEADVYERYDDETYIVCFADLDRAHAELKARRIVDSIKLALLEAASEVRHLEVAQSVAEVPDEELVFAEDESFIDALAGSLRKVRSEVDEAHQTWRRILLRDASIVHSPIWSPKNRTVLMCRSLLDDLTGKAALRRIQALSVPDDLRSTLADVDCVILDRAVRAFHELIQREERIIAVVPVNFQTLNEKITRESYLRLCRDMPSSYGQFLMMEVHGLSPGVPTSRTMELCQYLRPYCKGIIIEAPALEWGIARLDATSIYAVSVQLDQMADASLEKRLEKYVTGIQARGFHSMVHGADTIGLAQIAIRAGVDYISGKAVALPLDALKGAYHWRPPVTQSPVRPQGRSGRLRAASFRKVDTATGASAERPNGGDIAEPKAPRLQRLLEDWERWRAGRSFPTRGDFDPGQLRYVLGNVSLIELEPEPRRFRFRLHGSDNVAHLGVDLTGKYLDELPYSETRERVRQQFNAAIETRAPVVQFRQGAFSDGRTWRYEVLVLPFSRDGETIDMLMSAVIWGHQ